MREQKILSLAREKVGQGKEGAEDAGPREGDNCSWADGVDRQRWFLGQLNALSNDLLHDLVESVLTCCSAAQLHWFRSQVAFVRWCRHLLDCGLGGEEIPLPLFLPLVPAFLLGRCFDLKFVNEHMTHIFSQKP